jgi:predicted ArsR family transcriptional regulator
VDDPAREAAACVLASSGEVSAADLGGALGWRLKAARELLDALAGDGALRRRDADGLPL